LYVCCTFRTSCTSHTFPHRIQSHCHLQPRNDHPYTSPLGPTPTVLNRRHRRGSYALAPEHRNVPYLRPIILLLITGVVLYVVGSRVLQFFGIGNSLQQSAVLLTLENRGTISVSIEGEEFRRAEDAIKLYAGDRVSSSGMGYALLTFFDGTAVRLNEQTNATIIENAQGEKQSHIALELEQGSLWIATPTAEAFSGTILREIRTNHYTLEIPPQTEAVVGTSALSVFAADGLGIRLHLTGNDGEIFIGEGQQFAAPGTVIEGDPYAYRSALDPTAVRSVFIEESREAYARRQHGEEQSEEGQGDTPMEDGELLTVNEPKSGALIAGSTVHVAGSVGESVAGLRINGYSVSFNPTTRAFTHELSLPDADEATVLVEVLDSDGSVLQDVRRTVERDRKQPDPPVITAPAPAGATYQTLRDTVEITGTAPAETIGIIVNDYRLQLFQPGDETWSYLASTKLDNYHSGENVYTVVAIGKNGMKSEPKTVTILYGEGPEGIIEQVPEEPVQEGEEQSLEEEEPAAPLTLPDNIPLLPGSLQVTGPTPGTFHTATGTSFLIEGTTSERTASLWVNDYQLRLYEEGKTFFNYIADTKLGTLQRGANVYRITARDDDLMILDEVEYTVRFDPREN